MVQVSLPLWFVSVHDGNKNPLDLQLTRQIVTPTTRVGHGICAPMFSSERAAKMFAGRIGCKHYDLVEVRTYVHLRQVALEFRGMGATRVSFDPEEQGAESTDIEDVFDAIEECL
ncbi:MAG: hypothetical protein JNJ77_20045 [Planctomycetia bacterium]|nr:hypothetical protein [Planctomycetia bacterium]